MTQNVSRARIISAKCVGHIHLATVFFVLFGWVFLWDAVLIFHIVLIPTVVLQWKFNEGTCLLTNLENWLLGKIRTKDEQQGQFTKKIVGLCFNPLPSDAAIERGLYFLVWSSFSVSLIRLLLSNGLLL